MALVETNIPAGHDTKFFIGRYDISGYANAVEFPTLECEEMEVQVFGRWKRYKAGQRMAKLKVNGVYDKGDEGMRAIAESLHGSERNIFLYALGAPQAAALDYLAVGSVAVAGLCNVKAYAPKSNVKEISSVSWDLTITDPFIHNAEILEHAAKTASWDGTTFDATAARIGAAGGVGTVSVRLTSGEAGDTLDLKIQHSANGSSWTDLITFTQMVHGTTTNYAQRLTSSGAVYRYRRVVGVIAGTPAPTWDVVVAFAEAQSGASQG